MFCELETNQYSLAAPLFDGRFPESCSIRSLLAGNSSGRIFADRIPHPNWALAFTVEGVLLTGNPQDENVLESLRRFLTEEIFSGKLFGDEDELITMDVDPAGWADVMPTLIPTHEPIPINRLHFTCKELRYDWRAHLPTGYTAHLGLQKECFDGRYRIHPAVTDWLGMMEDWANQPGQNASHWQNVVITHNEEIICRCGMDCYFEDWVECGIFTAPEHRRKGLGAAAVAAFVEWAFDQGYKRVGWHCDDINHGSIHTALKVGFEQDQEYIYHSYQVNPVNHLAELGWFHYQRGNHQKTRECYEKVFAQREDNPNYFYHLAALSWGEVEDREKVLAYLQTAANDGWDDADYTASREEFAFLNADPEYLSVLETMRKNAGA